MEKTFVIAWKSKSEPRWGQGKRLLTRDEAAALAFEMNQEYPAFIHQPLNLAVSEPAPTPEPAIIHVDFQPAPALDIPVAAEAQAEEAVLA